MLAHEDLKKAGLLIFANKQDVKECMTVAEISQFLKLTSIKDHQWHIQACCALTGEGLCQGLEWMMSRLKIRWFLMTPLHRHCFKKKSCTRGYPHSGRIAGLGVFIMNWFQLYFLRRYTHIHTYINSDRSAKRKMQLMAQFVFLVVFLWRCVWKQWSAFLPRYSHWEQSDAECGEDEARERSYALGFHYYIVVLSSQRCGFVNFSKLANKSMA